MKIPKKYLTANPNVMKREIRKHSKKRDDDPSAYGPWDADYKSRKAKKGKRVSTKQSEYTKKFKKMYDSEGLNSPNILSYEEFNELKESLEIENVNEESSVDKALKNKSEKSGFPLGILRKVYKRGYASWKLGHRPGVPPQAWAMARVNSFIVGGRTTEMSDKALYKQAKKNRKKKKVNEQQILPADTTRVASLGFAKSLPLLDDLSRKYPCLSPKYRLIIDRLIKKGYDKKFLKVAVCVIGRESSDASGLRYNVMDPLKQLGNFFGKDTSVGPAQMKASTVKGLGLPEESLKTVQGAIVAVYKYIQRSYDIAKSKGYTNSPSVNFKDGTGDAALDISIASYNLGVQKIDKYCETSDPNVKKSCSLAGRKVGNVLVSKNHVPNYLPNYKTERWDNVTISTHGYVKEVADRLKKLNCF
jgi:hypothetical protein